jgi:hypothetical protein
MTATRTAPLPDIDAACRHLDRYGYCVFPELMPASEADWLARRFLQLHDDPACRPDIAGQRPYETLFGLMNREERVWPWASHPVPVAVAKHFLGPQARVAEVVSKPTWKDPHLPINLHVDSAHAFHGRAPDAPWLINTMWMVTDFTEANGATGIVPMSHHTRSNAAFDGIGYDSPLLKPVTGRRGTLFMWHAGMFHTSRPNRTDDIRVGLNIAYYPPWFNVYTEGGHQPVWPETYARMPQAMRDLCRSRKGRSRTEVYEHP